MGIFKIALSSRVNYEVGYVDLLLIWFKPIGVYWYLYMLIGLYIIFAYLNKIKTSKMALMIILAIISFLASLFVGYEGNLFVFRRIAYFGIVFYTGILLSHDEYKKNMQILTGGLFVISIVLSIIFWSNEKELYHIPIVNLVVALGVCLGFIFLFQSLSEIFIFKVLTLIGKNSLEVYLLHVFFAAGCRICIGRVGDFPVVVNILVVFIISLFFPILIGCFARKIHIYDFLFKPYIFYKKTRKVERV